MSHSLGGRWPRVYLGVALTSTATLLLELSLTRIFSVVLFYHFAFMAISLALFGLGAGAVCSYYVSASRRPPELWSLLGYLSTINMGVTIGALLIVLNQPVSIAVGYRNAARLVVIYFASSAPFFLAGIVISLAIAETIERVDRVYFWDLLGAGAGCLLLVPLLDRSGGPDTVLAAGALYAVAGALWYGVAQDRGRAWLSVGLAALLAVFAGANLRARWIDVRYAKGTRLEPEMFSRWNSFSRVGVTRHGGDVAIAIDADAATSIPQFAADDPSRQVRFELERNGPSLPYRIHPGARALIIGPGGGYDVARAIANGSKDITGVEINPIIVNDIMKGRFAEMSHGLYFRPEVKIHIDDGRSFVRRSREKYQVIQMTLVDTWASTAAGAFALSENNLYTTDAFVDYLEHLTGDGMLTITRWEFEPPRESLRVVSLAIEALRRMNAPEPWRHFLIGRDDAPQLRHYGAKDTVVVKRTPFTPEEIARGKEVMQESGMVQVYLPGEHLPNPFTELLRAPDPDQFEARYRYDISPVGDNRPFFFYTVRPADLWRFITLRSSEDVKVNMGVMMLFVALGASLVATAIILLLPPLLLGTRVPREPRVFLHLAYFFAIGVGYIMVEVGLIQRFVLFLGRPTYSLTVVVFSLLVWSGLGSYWSRRVVRDSDRRLTMVLVAVAATVGALAVVVQPLLRAEVGLPLWARCAVSVGLLFPAGFLMGMPFPSGLKRLEKAYPSAVRWGWAMNSASSVLGSVAAIFFAVHLGLMQTLLLGGAGYLVALAAERLTTAGAGGEVAAVAVEARGEVG